MADFLYEPVKWNTDYKDPFRFDDPSLFKKMMLESVTHNASDVFIQANLPILLLVQGKIKSLTERPLDEMEVRSMIRWAGGRDTAETQVAKGEAVNARYECFAANERDEKGARLRHAWRVNISPIQSESDTSAQIVMRPIPGMPPLPKDVGLSDEMVEHMTPKDGIVYVAGATGSGKTRTFASIIRAILEGDTNIKGNIITHEEPIEYSYSGIKSSHSVIAQSQIPNHFSTFYDANREAMRRHPVLILVGEMRDEESIRAAVEAALTGHTVFATVHAVNVATVMRRMISRFPEREREAAVFDILETVRVIMAQRLVRGLDGNLLALREWLVFDKNVREQLQGLEKITLLTQKLDNMLRSHGHSFEADIDALAKEGRIDANVVRREMKALGAIEDGSN